LFAAARWGTPHETSDARAAKIPGQSRSRENNSFRMGIMHISFSLDCSGARSAALPSGVLICHAKSGGDVSGRGREAGYSCFPRFGGREKGGTYGVVPYEATNRIEKAFKKLTGQNAENHVC